MKIQLASTPEEIAACFPVIAELRPQLSFEKFITLVTRMRKNHSYELAYLGNL